MMKDKKLSIIEGGRFMPKAAKSTFVGAIPCGCPMSRTAKKDVQNN